MSKSAGIELAIFDFIELLCCCVAAITGRKFII